MSEEATTETAAGGVVPTDGVEAKLTEGETVVAAQNVGELPDWAQKLITDVRGEAAKYRTEAKNAAEQAQAELTDRLAKAFGLKEEAPDTEKLAASLTEAQSTAQKAARELAIFKAAAQVGADPNRLLDSNSFMTSVSQVDPGDGTAITAAINAALAANPILKAVQAAAASGTELGGNQEAGLITDEQLARMTPEQIDQALREGKLRHLLA